MSTTTSRLSLHKPAGTENINVSTDLNNNYDSIDLNMNFRVCTSGTRPSSPYQGQSIYETDTGKTYIYDGSNWIELLNIANGIGQKMFARKTGNETVTSSTTLQSDDHLGISVAVNATYTFKVWLLVVGSNNGGDIKIGFTYPTGSTLSWSGKGMVNSVTGGTFGDAEHFALITAAQDETISYAVTDTDTFIEITGMLQTSSTSGGLFLRWAQLSSNATGTTLKANSWMSMERVA